MRNMKRPEGHAGSDKFRPISDMKTTIQINGLLVEFTDEVPTKPGAYWWLLHADSTSVVIVELWESSSGFIAYPTDQIPSEMCGLWSAPLVPVTEVERAWEEARRDDPNDDECWDVGYNESRAKRVVEGGE